MNNEMTQMNIRIPVALKRGGNQVIARHGKTPSDIVREVWAYIDKTQQLPDCICGPRPSGDDCQVGDANYDLSKSDELPAGPGKKIETLLTDFYAETGLPRETARDVTGIAGELMDEAYERMLDEYMALGDGGIGERVYDE